MTIHSSSYTRFEGSLTSKPVRVIALNTLRTQLSFLKTKLTLGLLWLGPIVTLLLIGIEYLGRNAMDIGAPEGTASLAVFITQIVSLSILFAAASPGVIADDLRFKTFQVYFTKPLSKRDYIGGKLLGLFLVGSLITVIPSIIIALARTLVMVQSEHVWDFAQQGLSLVVMSTILCLSFSCIKLGISSLSERTGFVVLAWIGILLVPYAFVGIFSLSIESEWIELLPAPNALFYALKTLGPDGLENIPMPAPWLAILVFNLAGLTIAARRVNKLEGIA